MLLSEGDGLFIWIFLPVLEAYKFYHLLVSYDSDYNSLSL